MAISRILLTGATGFLGSHLLDILVSENYNVTIIKRSTSDTWRIDYLLPQVSIYNSDCNSFLHQLKSDSFDAVIHLATDYGRGGKTSIGKMIETNILFPSGILENTLSNGVKLVINTHSPVPANYNQYSATKNAFMNIFEWFASNFPARFVNILPHYMYGERDDLSKFLPNAIEHMICKRPLPATCGQQKRDFIYVRDVAGAYLAAIRSCDKLNHGIHNFEIGTGTAHSLYEVIEKIASSLNTTTGCIRWGELTSRQNEPNELKANNSHTRKQIGWTPHMNLDEGLKRTVLWYERRYDYNGSTE